jgi:hypothetical protein
MARASGLFDFAVSIAIAGILLGLSGSAHAAKTIYKYTKDGQITLTDKPCDSSTSDNPSSSPAPQAGGTTIASSSNPSPVGDWHGQMQYQGRENAQALEEAHSVVPSLLTFTADGKVAGGSQEKGCKWSSRSGKELVRNGPI